MKLTMLIPYFKPEITAIVHLMEDIALDCSKYGADVTIITGYPMRGTSRDIREEYSRKSEEQLTDKIKIYRLGSKKDEGNSFILRSIRHIVKTFLFYKKAKQIPTEVYYIYSTPPSMGIIGGLLSKRAPTMYCLQDIFPDNLRIQKKNGVNKGIIKLLRLLESYVYRKNTHIVTISRDMKENLVEKDVGEEKISIIENWVDTEEVQYIPRKENPLFEEFNLDTKGFYVSYGGNLGHVQDIDIILDSAKVVKERDPEIKFLIIGNGVCKEGVKRRIERENISNVYLLPMQPEEKTAMVYSLGDIGLVTLKNDMHSLAMPSKTWAMMAASQPVITTAIKGTYLHEIFDDSNMGVAIKPGDYKALAHHILDLRNNRHLLTLYGSNGRSYAEQNFSRAKATKLYYELLKKISNTGGF